MAYLEVEDTMVVSDLSDNFSSDDDGEGLLPAPVRGVRNCGIPPFLSKLYDIVSDKASDSTISWVSIPNVAQNEKQVPGGATSFAIWNQADFINQVLPLMSKSNNFDSFITQLNNYGFKKLSWDRREYANMYFQEGKPHMLKNIKSKSSKQKKLHQREKLTREIEKLERKSREIDQKLTMFKEYVDNTMSKQKKIVQAVAKVIKSTFDHQRDLRMVHEMNVLGESSHAPSCVIQAEDEPLDKISEDQVN